VNYEDEKLKAEIRAILADLPADSPAVLAMNDDKTSIEIMHLISKDRSDLLDRLHLAHFDWVGRCFDKAAALQTSLMKIK
jgi:hypothetical protein